MRRRVRRGYRIRQCVDEGWNDGTESFGLKYRVIQGRIASLVWNHHFRDIRVGGLVPLGVHGGGRVIVGRASDNGRVGIARRGV